MTEGHVLGLIGGLGPGATVHYYRALLAAHEKRGRVPRLLIAHADFNRVVSAVTAKDYDALADYLAGLIAGMEAGGAELAAIVAVTPHICADRLTARSALPLIDMLSEVAREVKTRGWRRVALLGTRFTVETRMFGKLGDIEVTMPQPAEIDRMHAIYIGIVGGLGTPTELDELKRMARIFMTRDGAQAVLLAATDLSPILSESDVDFPMLDCAGVHIEAIARRLLD